MDLREHVSDDFDDFEIEYDEITDATEKELKANDPRQNYQIFLKGDGEFSIDLGLDDVPVV